MTPTVDYHVRYATPADTDAVISLRAHAEKWLRCKGIEQWTVSSTGERNIRDSINAGTTYVITTGAGDIAASLTLDAADLDFWTPAEAAQPALYLYKFMIRSDRRSRGLGDLLLDWCCARAEMAGALYLRLDCWRSNTGLHRYYQDRGFRAVDVRIAPGRQSGALFERVAEVRTAGGDTRNRLIDDTLPFPAPARLPGFDRYDPTGEAGVWEAAAAVVDGMRHQPMPSRDWSAALQQAARVLERHASEIRQAQGMYYRPLDGRR